MYDEFCNICTPAKILDKESRNEFAGVKGDFFLWSIICCLVVLVNVVEIACRVKLTVMRCSSLQKKIMKAGHPGWEARCGWRPCASDRCGLPAD